MQALEIAEEKNATALTWDAQDDFGGAGSDAEAEEAEEGVLNESNRPNKRPQGAGK